MCFFSFLFYPIAVSISRFNCSFDNAQCCCSLGSTEPGWQQGECVTVEFSHCFGQSCVVNRGHSLLWWIKFLQVLQKLSLWILRLITLRKLAKILSHGAATSAKTVSTPLLVGEIEGISPWRAWLAEMLIRGYGWMVISVVQDDPIAECILLYKFLWNSKDGRAHLCRAGDCRGTFGLRQCSWSGWFRILGGTVPFTTGLLLLPSPSCSNAGFTPLIPSPLMLPVSVTSPTVHVSLFDVHLFLLMNYSKAR